MSEITLVKKENKATRVISAIGKIFFKLTLVSVFIISHFVIFNFYLASYNEVNEKLLVATQQIAKCEKEKSELKAKLEESFLQRNIVTPVANALDAVSNFFTSEEKPVKPDDSISGKIKGLYEEAKAVL